MNEYAQLDIKYIAQVSDTDISPDELALLESVLPDLIVLMNQDASHDD